MDEIKKCEADQINLEMAAIDVNKASISRRAMRRTRATSQEIGPNRIKFSKAVRKIKLSMLKAGPNILVKSYKSV